LIFPKPETRNSEPRNSFSPPYEGLGEASSLCPFTSAPLSVILFAQSATGEMRMKNGY
jgi:hypothetical protein